MRSAKPLPSTPSSPTTVFDFPVPEERNTTSIMRSAKSLPPTPSSPAVVSDFPETGEERQTSLEVGSAVVYVPVEIARKLHRLAGSKWGSFAKAYEEGHRPTTDTTAIERAIQEDNLKFLTKKYIPPMEAAPKGLSYRQLSELRSCLVCMASLFAPEILPRAVVEKNMEPLSHRSAQAAGDFLDHRAHALLRVQEALRDGKRVFSDRAALVPLRSGRGFAALRDVAYALRVTTAGAISLRLCDARISPAGDAGAVTVYTLRLGKGHYYVGHTRGLAEDRLAEHLADRDQQTEFVRRHGIVGISGQKLVGGDDMSSEQKETAEVLRLMRQHGIDKVRGGKYTALRMSSADRENLRSLIMKRGRQAIPQPSVPNATPTAALPADMKILAEFVTGLRRRNRSTKVDGELAALMAGALERRDSVAGEYLRHSLINLLSAEKKGWFDEMEGGSANKPIARQSVPVYEELVKKYAAVPRTKKLLTIVIGKKTGPETLVIVPEEQQRELLRHLLNVRYLSDFVGLSSPQLHNKLSQFFFGIPKALAFYFCEGMEITQLHKRQKKIVAPRTVTGKYAGHRFGMDTTFLGGDPGAAMAKQGLDTASNAGKREAEEIKARIAADEAMGPSVSEGGVRGAAKWWPRQKNEDMVSIAQPWNNAWNHKGEDDTNISVNIEQYAEVIERGEQMRRICHEINDALSRKSPDLLASRGLSPFPYITFQRSAKADAALNKLQFQIRGMYTRSDKGYIAGDVKGDSMKSNTFRSPALLLTVIDMYSRKAWAYPASSKAPHNVLSSLALRYAMADGKMDSAPPLITVDNGKEFHSVPFSRVPSPHSSGVFYLTGLERSSRTLAQNETPKYTNAVKDPLDSFRTVWKKRTGGPPVKLSFHSPEEHARQSKVRSENVGGPAASFTRAIYDRQLEALKKQLGVTRKTKLDPMRYKSPFIAYARAMGTQVVTTKIPNAAKSGAHGPIESFHRTFKLMLAKETALQAAAAANAGGAESDQTGRTTWCSGTGAQLFNDPNLWCVTTQIIKTTLDKYNNTPHGATGVTPNQLWDASRALLHQEQRKTGATTKEQPMAMTLEKALLVVNSAEEQLVRTSDTKARHVKPLVVGDWVRIRLDASDRHFGARKERNNLIPKSGHDWTHTSRIYQINHRRKLFGSEELALRGIKDFDFYTYSVGLVHDGVHGQHQRAKGEPKFTENLPLYRESLLKVDKKFTRDFPELGRLFERPRVSPSPSKGHAIPSSSVTTAEKTKKKTIKSKPTKRNEVKKKRCALKALLRENGFKQKLIPGDGDCQFAALASQLGMLPLSVFPASVTHHRDYTKGAVRAAITAYMRSHVSDFIHAFDAAEYNSEPSLTQPFDDSTPIKKTRSFVRWLTAMERPGVYGTGMTLAAASMLYARPIRVWSQNANNSCQLDYVTENGSTPGRKLHLLLTGKGNDRENPFNHYSSLEHVEARPPVRRPPGGKKGRTPSVVGSASINTNNVPDSVVIGFKDLSGGDEDMFT